MSIIRCESEAHAKASADAHNKAGNVASVHISHGEWVVVSDGDAAVGPVEVPVKAKKAAVKKD